MVEKADPAVAERLRRSFKAHEAALQASLERSRSQFDHPGSKGDAVEIAVRAFLRAHLPRRLEVGHGEVIDRFGNRSPQHDILLLSEDQPFVSESGAAGLYVCEGVAAVGEVKSVLGSREITDLKVKGTKLRALKVRYYPNDMIVANESDRNRYYASPPFFGVALESRYSTDAILESLQTFEDLPSSGLEGGVLPPLDALFVLNRGTFINYGDGEGSLQFRYDDGTFCRGWTFLGSDDVLVHLFLWLHAVMPRVRRWGSVGIPYLIPTVDR